MDDTVYDRTVGLNMEKALDQAVWDVRDSIGVGKTYADVVVKALEPGQGYLVQYRAGGPGTPEFEVSLDKAVQWSVTGKFSREKPNFGVKKRAHNVFGCLENARFLLGNYSWPVLIGDLKRRLEGDITRCIELAKVHEAYCRRMDDYKGFMPKKTWATCDLCVHLQKSGIKVKDAAEICNVLGASEVGHLAYVDIHDNVRELKIDNESKMILQGLVQHSSVILPKATLATVAQMRALVEAL